MSKNRSPCNDPYVYKSKNLASGAYALWPRERERLLELPFCFA